MQDLRLAIRALRATPIVTAVAILSLALGMGANTAIFSLIDSLLLRPLPVTHPERLVTLTKGNPIAEPTYEEAHAFTYATFEQIRLHRAGFDGALVWGGPSKLNVRRAQENTVVNALWVSGDFFSTLGVPAVLGRTFTAADDALDGGPEGPSVVVSYDFWQQHLGGAAVIGTSLIVQQSPVTIVGVTPRGFFGVSVGWAFDVALPLKTETLIRPDQAFNPDAPWLTIMLRLKPGQSIAAASAALRAVQPQIRVAAMPQTYHPSEFLKDPFVLTPIGAGFSGLRPQYGPPLVTLFVIVIVVLLMACANIANLLLARHSARRHELSVRVALGASSWRLVRQALAESAVLVIAGTIVGILLATWASRVLVGQVSQPLDPVVLDLSLDGRVLAFTGALMIVTIGLFGLGPALRAAHVAPIEALNEHGRGATSHGHGHASSGLVVGQVALCLMLLVAAGLFLRTFERLGHVPLGFDPHGMLGVVVNAQAVPAADRNALYHRLVRVAAGLPGVAAAGGSLSPPLVGAPLADIVLAPTGTVPPANAERIPQFDEITPGWLATYGTPLRAGRDIDEHDTKESQPVMLVNEAFVRHFFPTHTLLGTALSVTARLDPLGDRPLGSKTIVGVVADAVGRSIREPALPTVYVPLAQHPDTMAYLVVFLVVRSLGAPPLALSRGLTTALHSVDPNLILTFTSIDEQISQALAQDRLVATLAGEFGLLALVLAGLGLYGLTAYAVARRRTELGIRMALGALPAGIVRLVLWRLFVLMGLGALVGAAGSLVASRLIASLLYGVSTHDPLTLVGAVLTLLAVGTCAGWLPAWRASRIDPADVLREG